MQVMIIIVSSQANISSEVSVEIFQEITSEKVEQEENISQENV